MDSFGQLSDFLGALIDPANPYDYAARCPGTLTDDDFERQTPWRKSIAREEGSRAAVKTAISAKLGEALRAVLSGSIDAELFES